LAKQKEIENSKKSPKEQIKEIKKDKIFR